MLDLIVRFDAAADQGRRTRPAPYPAPDVVARTTPTKIGRNDPCACGSGKKVKACCGLTSSDPGADPDAELAYLR